MEYLIAVLWSVARLALVPQNAAELLLPQKNYCFVGQAKRN